jgi:hypothetical protein
MRLLATAFSVPFAIDAITYIQFHKLAKIINPLIVNGQVADQQY